MDGWRDGLDDDVKKTTTTQYCYYLKIVVQIFFITFGHFTQNVFLPEMKNSYSKLKYVIK